MIGIVIPYGEGIHGRDAIYVGVNGDAFMVPRGVRVEVPFVVYETLLNAHKENGEPRFPGITTFTPSYQARLDLLQMHITRRLNSIHDEMIAKFDWLARSVGQRMRVDRATK